MLTKDKVEELKEKPVQASTIQITSERVTICTPDSFPIIFLLKHATLPFELLQIHQYSTLLLGAHQIYSVLLKK